MAITNFYSYFLPIQDTEGCQTYKMVLYEWSSAKVVPGNSTGEIKNVSTHTGGDGSGGDALISNAKKLA